MNLFDFNTLTTLQIVLLSLTVVFSVIIILIPWQWGIAITPLFIFLQRFNIHLSIGRSFQISFVVLPILYLKIILTEFIKSKNKKFFLKKIFQFKLAKWLLALFFIDFIYTVLSIDFQSSIQILFIRSLCYSTAFAMTFWYYKFHKDISFKVWIHIFSLFYLINAIISFHQWYTCTFSTETAYLWKVIDRQFNLEEGYVGAQSISVEGSSFCRPLGTFLDANLNGMFFLSTLPVFLMASKQPQKISKNTKMMLMHRFIPIIFLFIAIILFFINLSRSAFLGATITFCLILPALLKRYRKAFLTLFLFLLFLIGAIFLSSIIFKKENTFYKAIKARIEATNEEDPHIKLLKEAFTLAKSSKYIGTGLGTYGIYYQRSGIGSETNRDPHSTIGSLIVEQGIPGVLVHFSFITWFVYTTINALLKKSKTKLFLSVPFLSYIFSGIFYLGFYLPFSWYWCIFTSELFEGLTRNHKDDKLH